MSTKVPSKPSIEAAKVVADPTFTYIQYGRPGTNETIMCPSHLAPDGYVIVIKNPPTDYHILDETGDWVTDPNLDPVKARQKEYFKSYPIDKQLEAICDFLLNNPTKFNEMISKFNDIRKIYVK